MIPRALRGGAFWFQVVSSLSTTVVVLVAARSLPVSEFAAYALASALWASFAGVAQMSVVVIAIHSWTRGQASPHDVTNHAVTLVTWVALLACAGGALSGHPEIFWGTVCGSAVVLVDVLKRLVVARGRVAHAIINDIVAGTVTATAFLVAGDRLTGATALALQGGVYLTVWLALIAITRQGGALRGVVAFRAPLGWVRLNGRRLASSVGSSLASAGGGQIALIGLAAASDLVIAGYRILQTVFGPVSVVSNTLPLVVTGRVSAAVGRARIVIAAKTTALLWATTAVAMVAVLLLSGPLERFLGPTWTNAAPSVAAYAVLLAALQVNFGAQILLRTGTRTWPILTAGVIGGAGFALAAFSPFATALTPVLLAMAVSQLPAIAFGVWASVRDTSRPAVERS
ncbi:hypothetical protein [Demequina rhizosphaerae]|uniref:hypothetical protein n=1 Tax=Demequina rhizosphaerae TaxID=1638985 RepID=UPI000781D5E2|nr:hypothetical protein [Demequina rhizosphaerae]